MLNKFAAINDIRMAGRFHVLCRLCRPDFFLNGQMRGQIAELKDAIAVSVLVNFTTR